MSWQTFVTIATYLIIAPIVGVYNVWAASFLAMTAVFWHLFVAAPTDREKELEEKRRLEEKEKMAADLNEKELQVRHLENRLSRLEAKDKDK